MRDTLDDWAVCQLLISEAILEIENGGPIDHNREPWGGYFGREPHRTIYGVHELRAESGPGKAN